MNRNRMLIKNTIIIGIGQFVPKVLSFITLPLITLHLTTAEYGKFDYLISLAYLIIPIVTLQVQQATFRHIISSKDKDEASIYFSNSLAFIMVSIIPLIPIVQYLLPLDGFKISLMVFFLYLVQSLHGLFTQIARGLSFNKLYSASIAIFSIVNFIGIISFYTLKIINLETMLLSLVIAYVISVLFLIKFVREKLSFDRKKINIKIIFQMLKYSIPIIPSTISIWVVNLSDRIIVLNLLGADFNGIYAVSNKIPSLFTMAYSIFNLAWTEMASRVSDEGESSEYYSFLFQKLYRFLIGSFLVLVSLTPLLFDLLVNVQYLESYFQIPILYLSSLFSSIVLFYGGIFIALKETKQVGITSIIGAVLNVLINLILISKIGLYAASISTAISYFVILLYRSINLKKYVSIEYDTKDIVIGFTALILSLGFLYYKSMYISAINISMAIIYNAVFNKDLIYFVAKTFRNKGKE